MNISPEEAARSLAAVESSREAIRTAFRSHCGHYHLWLWGTLWIVMALLGEFLGNRGLRLFPWISIAGSIASVLIILTQNNQIRGPVNKRFVAALGAFVAFALASVCLLGVPTDPKVMFAYASLVCMLGYVIGGLWFDVYLVWTGLIVGVAILIGIFFFRPVFWWWFAAFAGGPLLGTGFYVRYGWGIKDHVRT